jgi:hypothetical protein
VPISYTGALLSTHLHVRHIPTSLIMPKEALMIALLHVSLILIRHNILVPISYTGALLSISTYKNHSQKGQQAQNLSVTEKRV